MIGKLLDTIYHLKNKDHIPPAPRMLKTKYTEDELTKEDRRVMRRLGIRDPQGLKFAMKKHGVATVDELIEILGHYEPKRRVKRRFHLALGRFFGGYDHNPHKREHDKAFRVPRDQQRRDEIRRRVQDTRKAFADDR